MDSQASLCMRIVTLSNWEDSCEGSKLFCAGLLQAKHKHGESHAAEDCHDHPHDHKRAKEDGHDGHHHDHAHAEGEMCEKEGCDHKDHDHSHDHNHAHGEHTHKASLMHVLRSAITFLGCESFAAAQHVDRVLSTLLFMTTV